MWRQFGEGSGGSGWWRAGDAGRAGRSPTAVTRHTGEKVVPSCFNGVPYTHHLEEQYAARRDLLTRREAFAIAARGSRVPVPEPPAADLERFTVVTTYGTWGALSGGGLAISADREVIVATAYGEFPQTDLPYGAHEPEPFDSLTVLVDRASGEGLAVCYCEAVVNGRLVDALAGRGTS